MPSMPLTAARGLTSWQLDLPALIAISALGGAYLLAVWVLRRRGQSWSGWRTASFLGLGLGSIVLVTMSSIGTYDRILFWPRAVQYVVLLGLTPLLLALGEPLELLRRSLTGRSRDRLDAAMRGRVVRVLGFPIVGGVLSLAALLVIYLTPLYRDALTDQAVQWLVQLGLLAIGCVYFLPQLAETQGILPSWCGYSLRTAFAFLDSLIDAVPGVVLMTMNGTIAGGYYRGLHRNWGPSLHWDQTIGGGLMFTLSEVVAIPLLIVLFVRWIREDEERAQRIDRQLDQATADDAPLTTRPWWEAEAASRADK